MKQNRTAWFASIVLLAIAAAVPVLAQEHEMSAEEQAMMQKWMEFAKPGPQHQQIAKMAGTWKLKVKSWMDPSAPPMESDATAKMEPVMGGRYVVEHVEGEDMMGMGQPFKGMGLQGYDNLKKKYVSTWVDNMGTGVMLMEGTCDASKTCTYTGEMPDVEKGGTMKIKTVVKHVNDNEFNFEMYSNDKAGKPFKSMEINYKRQI